MAQKISKEFGVEVKAYKCDVGDDALVTETFKRIDKELGPVTGLLAVSPPFTFTQSHPSHIQLTHSPPNTNRTPASAS